MDKQTYRASSMHVAAASLSSSTCWYCDHYIPHGQRFCGRDCAEAFEDDDRAAERRALMKQREINAMLA